MEELFHWICKKNIFEIKTKFLDVDSSLLKKISKNF